MYRCTECQAEYSELPQYCDCGNDEFEEIQEEVFEDDYEEPKRKKEVSKKLTKEEKLELEEEKRDKQKSLIALAVIAILCIVVFIIPPHKKPKMQQHKEKIAKQNVKLPSVYTYWDDTVPRAFRKDDPLANLPLLNTSFGMISPVLREYLVNIGKEFNRKWTTTMVDGFGECKVQFVINKEGSLQYKTIVSSSSNQTLDDSVLLLLTNITGFDVPPDDYKGEKIYISFTIDKDGNSKVSYPSK